MQKRLYSPFLMARFFEKNKNIEIFFIKKSMVAAVKKYSEKAQHRAFFYAKTPGNYAN